MLIRFVVENFLSFKEKTEFSMVASKVQRHSNHVSNCNSKRILKGSFILGANASGKSNFIKAIRFAKSIIIDNIENVNCDKKYFRIDNKCRNNPGVFQFDIYSNGNFYSYGFAISYLTSSIEEEWLYLIDDKKDKDTCIFLRSRCEDSDNYEMFSELSFSSKDDKNRYNVYQNDFTNPKMSKTLFLTDINKRISDEDKEFYAFKDVLNWFLNLFILYPDSKFAFINKYVENEDKKLQLESLLNYFDTGILKVSKKELDFETAFSNFTSSDLESLKADINKRLDDNNKSLYINIASNLIEVKRTDDTLKAYELVSDHGNEDELFENSEESDGTQRLFDLIPVFQEVIRDSVIFIDELDRSLHTKVAEEFISYFYKVASNNNSQLIVTTHDSNIMDLNFIRQDEIWFMERQQDHSSKLYSLNKFKERFDKNVEKDYLLGRYGAVPIFNEISDCSDAEE